MAHERLLRSYEAVAQKDHTCDFCNQIISPGDKYKADVIVYPRRNYRIIVWKKHDFPGCPFDPEEWERECLHLDEHVEMRLAA